jgi:hypothetical protein
LYRLDVHSSKIFSAGVMLRAVTGMLRRFRPGHLVSVIWNFCVALPTVSVAISFTSSWPQLRRASSRRRTVISRRALTTTSAVPGASGGREVVVGGEQHEIVSKCQHGDEGINRFELPALAPEQALKCGGIFCIGFVRDVTGEAGAKPGPLGKILRGARERPMPKRVSATTGTEMAKESPA